MGYLIGFLVAVYFAGLFKYDKGLSVRFFFKIVICYCKFYLFFGFDLVRNINWLGKANI